MEPLPGPVFSDSPFLFNPSRVSVMDNSIDRRNFTKQTSAAVGGLLTGACSVTER